MGMMLHRHMGAVEETAPNVIKINTEEVKPVEEKSEDVTPTITSEPVHRGRKRKE